MDGGKQQRAGKGEQVGEQILGMGTVLMDLVSAVEVFPSEGH